jgi:hypothetical protein
MITSNKSPNWEFAADVEFRCRGTDVTLVIDGKPVERQDKNKWRCGHYISKHDVVKMLTRFYQTDYQPPSEEVIGLMEGAVCLIGRLIDTLGDSINQEVERRIEWRQENNSRRMSQKQIDRELSIELGEDVFETGDGDADNARYLYLFRHQNGLTKIGYSKDPHRREKTIQAEDPRVHMLATRPGSSDQERRLHKIFADKRVRGEWFDLNETDVERLFWICGFNHTDGYCNG